MSDVSASGAYSEIVTLFLIKLPLIMVKFIFRSLLTFSVIAITQFCASAQKDGSKIFDSQAGIETIEISQNDIVAESTAKKIEPVKSTGKTLYGIASFYAKFFEGAVTATGEIFHHKNLTAASNNFKLNTWVRVVNVINGKSIIVRINDRMHPRMAAKGRVVDLSSSAAKLLSFTNAGIVKVRVEEVAKGTLQ